MCIECPSSFTIINGKPVKLKIENETERRLERRLKGIKSELTGLIQDTQAFNRNGTGVDPVWNEIRKNAVADTGSTNDFEEKFHIERLMVTTQENEDKFADDDEDGRFTESDGEEPLVKVELLDNNKFENLEGNCNLQAERQTKKGRARKFGCSVCSKSFDSEERLKTHYKNFHTTIPCKSCDKTFTNLKFLKGHEERVHTPKGSFPCPTCSRVFASRLKLSRHKRYTHENKTYRCSDREASFKTQSGLAYHVNKVHKPAPVPCPHCQIVFSHRRNLKSHLKLKHSDEGKPKPATCSKCGKLFSNSKHGLYVISGMFTVNRSYTTAQSVMSS
ncbi:putative zinc finger protein [Orchesella cincta]|uniref:Putative zinc finger protein n=1 Tax=Orchesella cincta TaxID=48709 RepID=A0A1D2M1C9_ORCCI|nr:putative zinc finger protein [Orchesella cincta]